MNVHSSEQRLLLQPKLQILSILHKTNRENGSCFIVVLFQSPLCYCLKPRPFQFFRSTGFCTFNQSQCSVHWLNLGRASALESQKNVNGFATKRIYSLNIRQVKKTKNHSVKSTWQMLGNTELTLCLTQFTESLSQLTNAFCLRRYISCASK